MDARTVDILETFGHAPYFSESTQDWTCDHSDHGGDGFSTRADVEEMCLLHAQDQYEADMLRDGTHPMLGGYDGSGR